MAKSEKTPLWKRFRKEKLSGGDMALFIISFTAVFGILCNNPGGSIYYLVMFGLYTVFWIAMAVAGGRRLVGGMWITASVLWGITLAYCVLCWVIVGPMGNPAEINSALALLVGVTSFVGNAMINPVLPILYRTGIVNRVTEENVDPAVYARNAELMIYVCLACIAFVALCFFAGWFWQKNRASKMTLLEKKKMEMPLEFKD